jgi:hypothetical protein
MSRLCCLRGSLFWQIRLNREWPTGNAHRSISAPTSISTKFKTVLQNLANIVCSGQVGGFARALAESAPKSESMLWVVPASSPPLR